jgi:heat shock protein HtpX
MRLAAARNLLKAWLVLAIFVVALGSLGWALGGSRIASLTAFVVVLAALAVVAYGDRAVMGMVGARRFALAEDPALASTVQRLSLKAGVLPPRLYVSPAGFPFALTAGRGPNGSALAVSTGLLGALPPAELEGVLAHELAHIRRRDTLVQTIAVLLAATLVEASRIGGWLERALLFVLGPIAAAFTHLLLSPQREYTADRAAAALCETPHGLADALIRLEQASELVAFESSPATEPLYTVNPFASEGLARMFETHPPPAERIARLRALDPEWRPSTRAA